MPPLAPACLFNIQKNLKTSNNKRDASVELLAEALRSKGPVGKALRTLVKRIKNPEAPYSREDLATLLVLAIAQQRNEERG